MRLHQAGRVFQRLFRHLLAPSVRIWFSCINVTFLSRHKGQRGRGLQAVWSVGVPGLDLYLLQIDVCFKFRMKTGFISGMLMTKNVGGLILLYKIPSCKVRCWASRAANMSHRVSFQFIHMNWSGVADWLTDSPIHTIGYTYGHRSLKVLRSCFLPTTEAVFVSRENRATVWNIFMMFFRPSTDPNSNI